MTHSLYRKTLAILLTSVFTAAVSSAEPGLMERPSNLTCTVPDRPELSAVNLQRPFPDYIKRGGTRTVEYPPNDSSYLYMPEQGGRIVRFPNNPNASTRTVVLNRTSLFTGLVQEGHWGFMDIAFHPDFENNGQLFLAYTIPGDNRVSRVERYVSSDGGASFSTNGTLLLSLPQNGIFHGVATLWFGLDGYLYVVFGDGGNEGLADDPFAFNGKILRIDVDGGDPYSIPPDNPFADGGGAPEVYAMGFRNPWRVTQDSETGEIWAADVGLADWEEINKVVPGGNYGWPTREGAHCRRSGCDPNGLIDPVYEYSHDNGCAVIGGYVYRGSAIPGLYGKYIFADLCSSVISSLEENQQGINVEALLSTGLDIQDFSESPDGEFWIIAGSDNRLFELAADQSASGGTFPIELSDTGCVDPSNPTQPAEGVIPYDVNTALWSDGADKRRWLALPEGTQIEIQADGDFEFPIGTVLMKEFSTNGTPFETRLLVRHDDGGWAGYTYEWNDELTNASLVSAAGLDKLIDGQLDWTYPSRAQCLECHSAVSGRSLGPETAQLNGSAFYPQTGLTANQLETLDHIGLFAGGLIEDPANLPALGAVDDASQSIEHRARSYLHANCAMCHRPEGPGEGPMDFRYQIALKDMSACEADAQNGDLGVAGAKIIVPGDASRSVVSLRMHALGTERMPPLGTRLVDDNGTSVVDAWINSLTACAPDTIPPAAPSNLQGVGVSEAQIDLTWDPVSDESGIASYTVYRNGQPLTDVTAPAYSDTGLLPGATFEYSVTATDGVGIVSPASASVTVSTLADTTPPSSPPNLLGVGVSDAQIDLSWDTVSDASGIASYTVYRNGQLVAEVSTSTYSDGGLPPGTSFEYSVTATDGVGLVSTASATVTAATLADRTPPTAPQNLQATVISSSQIDLSWDAASDNGSVASYSVYRDGNLVVSTPELTFSDTGLGAGTAYRYMITATDAAGLESSPSTAVSATTSATPAPPTPSPQPNQGGGGASGPLTLVFLLLAAGWHRMSRRRR